MSPITRTARMSTKMITGRDSPKLADKQSGISQSLRRHGSGRQRSLDAKLQLETGGRFETGHSSGGSIPVSCPCSRLRVSNETRHAMLLGIVLWGCWFMTLGVIWQHVSDRQAARIQSVWDIHLATDTHPESLLWLKSSVVNPVNPS